MSFNSPFKNCCFAASDILSI